MKKVLLLFIILVFSVSFAYSAEESEKPYNIGYAKRYGMVGLYGHLNDYISDTWGSELYAGGGGFIYYNVLNDFWGNLSIGFSADYVWGDFTSKKYNVKGHADMAPLAFNIAYMTSSTVVNAWAGIGVSYNIMSMDIQGGKHYNVTYDSQTLSSQVVGVDAFAGLEYLFTKDGRWGAFFEFRYTYSQFPELNVSLGNKGSFTDEIDTQRFKYTVGFSYHF